MSMQVLIDHQLEMHRLLGRQICREMSQAIVKLGFPKNEIEHLPEFDKAEFSLKKDPYTCDENLTGYWYDGKRQRIGNIQFLSDGSFYAEYDVIKPHPLKKRWFVEAVNAWGRKGHIKTEAKLLPALE
ncbi:hypothetical protein [Methylomarinum vadi]|uniref:hypothetical protein n=1 Tax=Methylomarinum vadi TaxID=438855 RepID=UPI00068D6268|nr:hypothetical protein [Methylomarinum vadi]